MAELSYLVPARSTPATPTALRRGLLRRGLRALVPGALALTVIALAGLWAHRRLRAEVERQVGADLQAVLATAVRGVTGFLADAERLAALVADAPDVRAAATAGANGGDAQALARAIEPYLRAGRLAGYVVSDGPNVVVAASPDLAPSGGSFRPTSIRPTRRAGWQPARRPSVSWRRRRGPASDRDADSRQWPHPRSRRRSRRALGAAPRRARRGDGRDLRVRRPGGDDLAQSVPPPSAARRAAPSGRRRFGAAGCDPRSGRRPDPGLSVRGAAKRAAADGRARGRRSRGAGAWRWSPTATTAGSRWSARGPGWRSAASACSASSTRPRRSSRSRRWSGSSARCWRCWR